MLLLLIVAGCFATILARSSVPVATGRISCRQVGCRRGLFIRNVVSENIASDILETIKNASRRDSWLMTNIPLLICTNIPRDSVLYRAPIDIFFDPGFHSGGARVWGLGKPFISFLFFGGGRGGVRCADVVSDLRGLDEV